MSRSLTILLATIAGVILATILFRSSVTAVAAPTVIINADVPETVEEWIEHYAREYQADATELKKVVFCESGNRVAVYGDGGRAFGPAQFHKPTFQRWSAQLGESLDYYNFQHQIKLMAWAFSKGSSYKDDWTCWTKLYRSR